jgi:hypothetical protein
MLQITIRELEDLRVKLLAAVLSGSFELDASELAFIIAKDLDGLVALLEHQGVTSVCADRQLADMAQVAIEDRRKRSSASSN